MSTILKGIQLSQYNAWKVGGPAEFYTCPTNEDEIAEALDWAQTKGLPIAVLSGGTNVLVNDSGIRGLVIHLKKFVGVSERIGTIAGENRIFIEAKAGTSKSELLKIFLRHELAPAVFLAGIPGDVGGGIVTNAGVGEKLIPREFVEIVDWIEVMKMDRTRKRFKKEELKWTYRHCEGWKPGIIISVGISWPFSPDSEVLQKVRSANHQRMHKQPLEFPNCGSVFVNPEGHKAGELIEGCGLKGYSVGDAEVSLKHANFIINKGKAKAADIREVIDHVQKVVADKTGISLKTEVVILN